MIGMNRIVYLLLIICICRETCALGKFTELNGLPCNSISLMIVYDI